MRLSCVPSKTLISCANAAHAARSAGRFGVSTGEVRVDYGKVMERVRATIDKIYDEDDSPEALAKLGIDTVVGQARFLAPKTVRLTAPPRTARCGHGSARRRGRRSSKPKRDLFMTRPPPLTTVTILTLSIRTSLSQRVRFSPVFPLTTVARLQLSIQRPF